MNKIPCTWLSFAHPESMGTFLSLGGKVLKEILPWQWDDGIFSCNSSMYIYRTRSPVFIKQTSSCEQLQKARSISCHAIKGSSGPNVASLLLFYLHNACSTSIRHC